MGAVTGMVVFSNDLGQFCYDDHIGTVAPGANPGLCQGRGLFAVGRSREDGDQVVSRLGLVRKPTNLGKGNTWLFRSFRTGKLCRVLYLVRGMFVARADIIGPRYTQQLKGRTGRMWLRYNRYQTPPTRAKGKTTYRGKLTPYGKRLERYDLLADDLYLDTIVYMARRYKIWRDIPSLEPLKDLDL